MWRLAEGFQNAAPHITHSKRHDHRFAIKTALPNLDSIIRVGAGVDNIDTAFCGQEGIRVYNAPGANADAVSDYVVCMMLVVLRKVFALNPDDITSWNRFKFTGSSISAQSVGIIGFGKHWQAGT